MNFYEFDDYKELVNDLVLHMPNNGRGVYRRISEYLGVSSVLISQIFKGNKEISLEQALKLTQFLEFKPLEKKFFLNLVLYSKAGAFDLKAYYESEIEEVRSHARAIEKRVEYTNILSEKDKGIFYSNWKYSAIRLACDIQGVKNEEDLAKMFNLSVEKIKLYLSFLLEKGLIQKTKEGMLVLGPCSTHLSKDSSYIDNHHRNWRLKALETIDLMEPEEVMYTAPMAISKEMFEQLNQKILEFIDELVESASNVKASDDVYYLNLDLRKMKN